MSHMGSLTSTNTSLPQMWTLCKSLIRTVFLSPSSNKLLQTQPHLRAGLNCPPLEIRAAVVFDRIRTSLTDLCYRPNAMPYTCLFYDTVGLPSDCGKEISMCPLYRRES